MNEMNGLFLALNLVVLLIIGLILVRAPWITQRSLFFGVRVPVSAWHHPSAQRLRRIYAGWTAASSAALLFASILLYVKQPDWTLLAAMYLPLLLLLIQFLIYVFCWRSARHLKQVQEWQTSATMYADTISSRSRQSFRDLPWSWYLISALLCLIAVLVSLAVYPTLPDVLVKHWNFAMEADAWAEKSLLHIIIQPLLAFVMVLFMLAANLGIYRSKLQVENENPALSFARHRLYRRLMSHVLGFITLVMTVMFVAITPMTLNLWVPSAGTLIGGILFFSLLMLIPPIWVTLKAGQAGNRLKPEISSEDRLNAGILPRDLPAAATRIRDDRDWKLGLFYFNRDDPSLFVENRFGSNNGLNYARKAAWLIVGILAAVSVMTYYVTTVLLCRLLAT